MFLNQEYYDREKLYKEVWERPVSKVAKDYGISDVGLAKVCRKLQVPLPGLGYWAKKAHGKEPPTPPLPELESPPKITRSKKNYQKQEGQKEPEYLVPEEHAWVLKQIAFEKEPKNRIKVVKNPQIIHPIADSTVKYLRKGGGTLFSASMNDKRICSNKESLFFACIGRNSVERLLPFLNTLLTEMEKREMKIESKKNFYGRAEGTNIVIKEESIPVRIFERAHKRPPSKEDLEREKHSYSHYDHYLEPDGKIEFQIDHGSYSSGTIIRDTRKQKIEDRINEIFISLYKIYNEKVEWTKSAEIRKEKERIEAIA